MPKQPPSAAGPADLLARISREADAAGALPPVHLWNPPLCDNVQMRIDRGGRWYYQNSPIGRERMVRLFSTVLRLDDDGCHYLVTPVEKILVRVEQCPFVITGWQAAGRGRERVISLHTNVGDEFLLDQQHPLRLDSNERGEPVPCVPVRSGLEALIGRSVFYQMVEMALDQGDRSESGRSESDRGKDDRGKDDRGESDRGKDDRGESGRRGLFSCGCFFALE